MDEGIKMESMEFAWWSSLKEKSSCMWRSAAWTSVGWSKGDSRWADDEKLHQKWRQRSGCCWRWFKFSQKKIEMYKNHWMNGCLRINEAHNCCPLEWRCLRQRPDCGDHCLRKNQAHHCCPLECFRINEAYYCCPPEWGLAVTACWCWQFPDCSFEWPKCASQSTITENMAWPMCRSKASLLKLSAKKQEQMKNQEVPKHKYKNGWRIAILQQPRALYEARTKGLSRQSSLWPTMGNVSISRYWRNNHRNRCRKRHGSLNGKKHRNEKPFRRWIYKIQEI